MFVRCLGGSLPSVSHFRAGVLVSFLRFVVLQFQFRVARRGTVRRRLAIVQDVARVPAMYRVSLANLFVVIVRQLIRPVPSDATARGVYQFCHFPMVRRIATNIPRQVDVFKGVRQMFSVVVAFRHAAHPTGEQVLIQPRVRCVVVAFVLSKAKFVRLLRHVVDDRRIFAESHLIARQPSRSEQIISVDVGRLRRAYSVHLFPFCQV